MPRPTSCRQCQGMLPDLMAHRGRPPQFCSSACRSTFYRKATSQISLHCYICSTLFLGIAIAGKPQRYCSTRCRNKAKVERRPKASMITVCKTCGATVVEIVRRRGKKSQYCSDVCRRNRLRSVMRVAHQKLREVRRMRELCVQCGAPGMAGRSRCHLCAARQRSQSDLLVKAGRCSMCRARKPSVGKRTCDECRARALASRTKRPAGITR